MRWSLRRVTHRASLFQNCTRLLCDNAWLASNQPRTASPPSSPSPTPTAATPLKPPRHATPGLSPMPARASTAEAPAAGCCCVPATGVHRRRLAYAARKGMAVSGTRHKSRGPGLQVQGGLALGRRRPAGLSRAEDCRRRNPAAHASLTACKPRKGLSAKLTAREANCASHCAASIQQRHGHQQLGSSWQATHRRSCSRPPWGAACKLRCPAQFLQHTTFATGHSAECVCAIVCACIRVLVRVCLRARARSSPGAAAAHPLPWLCH